MAEPAQDQKVLVAGHDAVGFSRYRKPKHGQVVHVAAGIGSHVDRLDEPGVLPQQIGDVVCHRSRESESAEEVRTDLVQQVFTQDEFVVRQCSTVARREQPSRETRQWRNVSGRPGGGREI
jgi:hypothetical protein